MSLPEKFYHYNMNYFPENVQHTLNSLSEKGSEFIEQKNSFWKELCKDFTPENLQAYKQAWEKLYKNEKAPLAWMPGAKEFNDSAVGKLLKILNLSSWKALHEWSVNNRAEYWEKAIQELNIQFKKKYKFVLKTENSIEDPVWLEDAELNIIESCFTALPLDPAIIQGSESNNDLRVYTYADLEMYVNRIASGLSAARLKAGDRIVIYMPMTAESIAAYLAIVKSGMVVVSVADSFSSSELKKRIEITGAKAVFTCDAYMYAGKKLEIYKKVREADAPFSIVCPICETPAVRENDILLENFLQDKKAGYHIASPSDTTNILFSSGTTKEPKAIPWTHLTPIKCAADAHFHLDVNASDVITWTTGMGWMMAPWLIYAGLINKACIAIYNGAAAGEGFGKFAEKAGITIMGVIPSVVKLWKANNFLEKFNWKVRIFSSTGEPSGAEDYFYLMAMSGFKGPIIEYCGGTEIGGGYITGSVLQPASPATFTTPALGLDFYLLDEKKEVAGEGDAGEVFIIPPSIGLTQTLLNRNHHEEYYAGVPKGPKGEILRKHGDAFERLEAGGHTFYKSAGRTDDAMNLGGIKVSAVEIEEVLNTHPHILETAAVGISKENAGPESLVVFFVTKEKNADKEILKKEFQSLLTKELNPLFRISEIIQVPSLPRTASNKLMRRELRKLKSE